MSRDERLEDLRSIWGPPPVDPAQRSIWERQMELLADLPDAVASLVDEEGTLYPTLAQTFGALLARLEGEVVWRYFTLRKRDDDVRDAVVDVLKDQPWQAALHGFSPVRKTRVTDRLADEVADNIGRVFLTEPRYRAW